MTDRHPGVAKGGDEEPNQPNWPKLLAAIAQVIMALTRLFHDL